ncbi:superoxide dismutase [Priestia megaterium]|nr:superoxide dismutase [Priestia megaterium]
MDYQHEAKEYLTEVQKWLEEVNILILDSETTIDEDVFAAIDRTKEDIKEQLDKQEMSESLLAKIDDAVRYINEEIQPEERAEENLRQQVPIGKHTLPPLPYSYNALEPYINSEIMKLHHTKHHQSYVDGLNKAENKMQEARETHNFELLKHWEREAAFHGSGHYLHTIFWEIMNPNGGGKPKGELSRQIQKDFGSYEKFKKHFSEAAKKVEGVGWAILVWAPRSHRLEILQAERHQLLTQWDTIPLLVLDVWEHAYYLQYKNERDKYVDNWWNVVYWPNVEKRFKEAKKLKWQPY